MSNAHENSLLTTALDAPDVPAGQGLPDGWLAVESLDIDAQGIAHRPDGKVVFIEGALPFEVVSTSVHRKKNNWEAGTVTAVHRESSQRVRPGCPHFGLHAGACGGCKMQHLHVAAQVAFCSASNKFAKLFALETMNLDPYPKDLANLFTPVKGMPGVPTVRLRTGLLPLLPC